MVTFLPFPCFKESARCLDRERLGKQRGETVQILNTLFGRSLGWQSYPAVVMWRGYEDALIAYGLEICDQWQRRGYKDNTYDTIHAFYRDYPIEVPEDYDLPWWLGNDRLHKSHRSRLVAKQPSHYKVALKWDDEPGESYWWPGPNPISS